MAKKSKIRKNKKSFFHFGNDEILNLEPVFILVMREESALIGCSISHVTPHPPHGNDANETTIQQSLTLF